ncbi:MAG: hypothetical protein WC365_02910 [Candidatus Babeliales bacterium]|jgi:outer membrane murein-binding lipoprotein Lpp
MKMIKTAYVLLILLGPILCYAGGAFGQQTEERPTSVASARDLAKLQRQVTALESRVDALRMDLEALRQKVTTTEAQDPEA